MRKGLRLIKRLVALSLVLLLSIESFAAVVADNDGAAFITKAEFDSLKSTFQAQIDRYNSSIDNKIDGAIASYLAGIRTTMVSTVDFYDGQGNIALVCDTSKINDLKWGRVNLDIDVINVRISNLANMQSPNGFLITGMERKVDEPFEIFLYDANKNKMLYYADDAIIDVKGNNQTLELAAWGMVATTITRRAYWRWHGFGDVKKANLKEIRTFDNTVHYIDNSYAYNTWLASPNWLVTTGCGANMMWGGTRIQNGYEESSNPQLVRNNYTIDTSIEDCVSKVYTVFDDTTSVNPTKLWTPCNELKTGASARCLNSVYDTDTSIFAVNYDKTGRTLKYNKPSDSDVFVKKGVLRAANGNGTNVQYVRENKTGSVVHDWNWHRYGTAAEFKEEGVGDITAGDWTEPYCDNNTLSSSTIINASVDDKILTMTSGSVYTGTLVEGIPIIQLVENSRFEFNMDLPANLVIGVSTKPFKTDCYLRDIQRDNDLDLYVDGVEAINKSSVEVAQGKHKFSVVYKGGGKANIFFKVGRPYNDNGTSRRYKVELPKTGVMLVQN